MKKAFKAILSFITTLFALLIAIPFLIIFLLWIPFDYIRYRSSPYCKNLKEKYSIFTTGSSYIKFYNAVEQLNLPVEFHKNNSTGLTYFIYGDVVIIVDELLSFDDEHGFCISTYEDDENETFETLDETAARYLSEANELLGGTVCKSAVYFVKEENMPDVDDSQYEILLSRGDVIVYSDETLKQDFTDFAQKK